MALATQCPHCQTTFKVAHDQLKLRAGLVRCGACKQIFNGIEHLLRPEQEQPAAAAVPAPPAETRPSVKQDAAPDAKKPDMAPIEPPSPLLVRPTSDAVPSDPLRQPDPKPEPPPPASSPADDLDAQADPLQRMTLIDFTDPEQILTENAGAAAQPITAPPANTPDPLDEAIEALQRKPLRSTKKTQRKERRDADEPERSEDEEPSFVKQGRRRQRMGRALRILMGIGSLLLLIGLLAQGAYVFRNELAARFPAARLMLAEACAMLDCQIGLPAQIEAVSIESSELQALAPGKDSFTLTVLMRNHGDTEQAWPNIELTLNDANEKAIVRRVFTPRDYLPSAQDLTGFAPKSEQAFKLFFELSQLKASGYRVYLFYP